MFMGATGIAEIAKGSREGRKESRGKGRNQKGRESLKRDRRATKSFRDTKVRGGVF